MVIGSEYFKHQSKIGLLLAALLIAQNIQRQTSGMKVPAAVVREWREKRDQYGGGDVIFGNIRIQETCS